MTNLDLKEQERRKQNLFFEVTGLDSPPELAKPGDITEDEEEVEAFLGIVGAVIGGVVGGVATGATGLALVASIAQGIATGYAIGSMVEGLFTSPDNLPEPERLPDPTYSFNTAGSKGLAQRGGVIPIIYASKSLNPKGGVRYMGKLIYSKMENRDSSGKLIQAYVLGNSIIKGNKQRNLRDTLLVNGRLAKDQFFINVEDEDEIKVNYIKNASSGLSDPFNKEFSQAVSPNEFQQFGYKLISEVNQADSDTQTDNTIDLPNGEEDDPINKFMVYKFSPKNLYGVTNNHIGEDGGYTFRDDPKFLEFRPTKINLPGDNPAYRIWANRTLRHNNRDKILQVGKFYYSTTKLVNQVDFNFDYILFGKDLEPEEN